MNVTLAERVVKCSIESVKCRRRSVIRTNQPGDNAGMGLPSAVVLVVLFNAIRASCSAATPDI